MPLTKSEINTRRVVEVINRRLADDDGVSSATDKDTIRAEAIAAFTSELDQRLSNLQDGEQLQITFRVDILGADGTVRAGSGRQRNMPEYIAWRTKVFERDGYTCVECGQKGNVEAHHIKPWASHPQLRFEVSNGLTLCRPCHREKHRQTTESAGL